MPAADNSIGIPAGYGLLDQALTAATLQASGVQFSVLLALLDEGAPSFDRRAAGPLAALGIPGFACTPGRFRELLAAAIQGRKLTAA